VAGTDGLTTAAVVVVEEAVAALSEPDRVHPASDAETSRKKPENFIIVSKDRDTVEISSGSTRHFSTMHRAGSGTSPEPEVSGVNRKRGEGD
jgi:hypothetical protein